MISQSWEQKYPQATLKSLIRVGSDHTPLLLETEANHDNVSIFRFETMWLKQKGFKEMITKKFPVRGEQNIQEFWKDLKQVVKKACRG